MQLAEGTSTAHTWLPYGDSCPSTEPGKATAMCSTIAMANSSSVWNRKTFRLTHWGLTRLPASTRI